MCPSPSTSIGVLVGLDRVSVSARKRFRNAGAGRSLSGEKHSHTADERGEIGFWENADIQEAIAQIGFGEDAIFAAVKNAVADQDKFAGGGILTVRGRDGGWFVTQRDESGPDAVSKRAELFLLQLPNRRVPDGAGRQESSAGELGKIAAFGFTVQSIFDVGQVNFRFFSGRGEFPKPVQVLWAVRSSLAKTLTVPSGSTPRRARSNPSGTSAMPLSVSLSVPSLARGDDGGIKTFADGFRGRGGAHLPAAVVCFERALQRR